MENVAFRAMRPITATDGFVWSLYDDILASPATWAVLAIGLAIQVVLVLAHGVNKELLGDRSFLALDKDANLPAWTETALFVGAGIGCGLLAWLKRQSRWSLALLAVVAMLMSLEQMAQLHTRVEDDLGGLATKGIEPLMAIGLVLIVVNAARHLPRLSKVCLWGAVAAIALAQGSSMLNSEFTLPHAGLVFFQTTEEVGEMLTATLLIAAVVQPILDGVVTRVLSAHSQQTAAGSTGG
jgi:hypothetical protein